MKKITTLLVALTLSACATTPTKPVVFGQGKVDQKGKPLPVPEIGEAPSVQMPDLPEGMRQRATRLPAIEDGTLKGIQRDGADVDSRYNDVAIRHNALLDAWACVRQAVNSRDASKVKACFK